MRIDHALRSFALAGILAVATPAAGAEEQPLLTPIPLDPNQPERMQVGELAYLAGYRIAVDNPAWGGFSDLCVYADAQAGTRIVAIGDSGIEATLGFVGTPEALGEVAIIRLFALRTPDGRRLIDKESGDAEAMHCDSPDRRIVAFEHQHRLWDYDGDSVTVLPFPTAARMLTPNEGIEGITRLLDGRLFMIAEGAQQDDRSAAWVETGDGGWAKLTVRRGDGFQATGLARLPDGDLLLLERFYTPEAGAAARISVIRAAAIRPDADIRPREIARLVPPMNVDNIEGIAVAPAADGGALVFLLSDDNFNPLQRTLLLVFRFDR
jgi:hypothetical protein